MYSGGLAPDGIVYCKHMSEEAAKRKSNTPKHPNREFYCCKRLQSDQTKCKFWYWADQVPRALVHPSGSSAAQSPPRTPKEGSSRGRQTAGPPTLLSQKPFSPSRGPETPQSSKKRLEDIEAGLKQREQDLSPIRHQAGPSEEPGPSTVPSEVPQPPSPVPTEIDEEAEAHPKSFLGLDRYSPEPIKPATRVEDQPPTSKKRRLTPPTKSLETRQAAEAASLGGGVPITPPRTTRHVTRPDGLEPGPTIMRSRKGKEREGTPPVCNQDQQEGFLPVFTLPEDGTSISSVSPTIAENVLDYTGGVKARVKALSEYMDSFDVSQATELLRVVERQKIQYECRDRNQKARIEKLAAEKDELVAEVARLTEALERSEESNRVKAAEKGWDD